MLRFGIRHVLFGKGRTLFGLGQTGHAAARLPNEPHSCAKAFEGWVMAKVLLIEPDRLLAETYAACLQRAGHDVNTVMGAQAAINAADDCTPDIVLLELQLVAHSGIEFLYEFRSYVEWQDIPVIILSHVPPQEFSQSADMLKAKLGVRAYLYKPATNLKMLLRTVEAVTAVV